MMREIDLNCDVGEGAGVEAALLPWVTSANVACGAHAGDGATMAETMELARSLGVVVGAHPGFADREHFGRRELSLSPPQIEDLVGEQLRALASYGVFRYVKPHGALYNLAAREPDVAEAIASAVRDRDAGLALMGLAGGALIEAGRAAGLRVVREVFADRGYDDAGRLLPRGQPGAVIEREDDAVAQALGIVLERRVRTHGGGWLALSADSICLHGDGSRPVEMARRLRSALESAGVAVRAFAR